MHRKSLPPPTAWFTCATDGSSAAFPTARKHTRVRLFSWFILRRLRRETLRSTITIVGMALGIGVIVAIRLTNASSVAGFETALDTVSGRVSLELVGHGLGIDELVLKDLDWLREYGQISPVIEGNLIAR